MRWKTTLVLLLAVVGLGSYVSLVELKQPTREEHETLAKRLLQLPAEDVTHLVVEFPQAKLTLHRTSDAWRLISPLDARADGTLVTRILNHVDPLETERVLAAKDKPLALADFGLEPPLGTLSVMANSRTTILQFGHPTAVGDNRYLRLADSPNVAVVSGQLFNDLNQPVEAYRSHDLIDLETWSISRITLTIRGASLTLVKQDQRWQLTEPLSDLADAQAVATFLGRLRKVRIERFLSEEPAVEQLTEWGFESPTAHVSIAGTQDTASLEVFIGHPTSDNPEELYAKRKDEPTLYTVAKSSIEELRQDPQILRSRTLFGYLPDQLTKLTFTSSDGAWTIERVENAWRQVGSDTALDVARVEELLWKLHDAKLSRFVEDHPQDPSRYGLEPSGSSIHVWVVDQQEPVQLLIGEPIGQGADRYGYLPGRRSVVELPETISELLSTTPESLQSQPTSSQPTEPSSTPAQ